MLAYIIRCLATIGDRPGEAVEIIGIAIGIFGGEGDDPDAVIAGSTIQTDLADRLAECIAADQRHIGTEIGDHRVDHQFAG